MATPERANAYWTTTVCIDTCQDGNLTGRLYNPYLPYGVSFIGVFRFLNEMETLLDMMQLPQSYTARRSFRPTGTGSGSGPPAPLEEVRRGKRATFSVRVLFRQNASWQGSVTWVEGKREEAFRSVLELLLLMDSVFQDKKEKTPETGNRFPDAQSAAGGAM